MGQITIEELTNYLNNQTGGFVCPICRHQQWQAEQSNGRIVSDVKLMTEGELKTILIELIKENGGDVSSDDDDETSASSILTHLAVVRCGHCGWVSLFDRAFIGEKIHDKRSA